MIPFMRHDDLLSKYGKDSTFEALQMPYENEGFSMLFIKTHNPLTPSLLNQVKSSLFTQDVNVKIPKFKQPYKADMLEKYSAMGLNLSVISFPYLADESNGSITNIIHEAVVDVDETGTEASACTVYVAQNGLVFSSHMKTSFIANSPFYYLIMKDETILFVGYFDPA